MAEEKGHHTEAHESEGHNLKEMGVCDSWYCKIMDWVTTQVADFVAFLFIVFSLGMVYGWFIVSKNPQFGTTLLLVPPILGVIAYFNRAFATAIFILVILLVIIL